MANEEAEAGLNTTEGDWEARPIKDWESGELNGWLVYTPPHEEMLRRIKENDLPCTSRRIARLEASHYVSLEECEANAKLMAAAKEMRSMLARAVAALEGCGCDEYVTETLLWPARALLEKLQ